MIKYLKFIIPIIILIISLSTIAYLYNRKISFYKCSEKPNSELLDQVLEKNNIIRSNINSQLFFPCGYNDVEDELDEIYLPKTKYIFALKGCDKIVSKNNLWEILENKLKRNNAKKIMPESFIIEDPLQFEMAQKALNNNVLICKKNLQRKLGLKLVFNQKQLKKAKKDEFTVAQIFLENATAIKGRKMNLRIYFAIKKVGKNIYFYINNNGKILYTKNKTTGKITFESHITSYQMDNQLYDKENLPHDFIELEKYYGTKKYNAIWNKIIDKFIIFSKSIKDVFDENKFNDKICFQLFGIDVILDGDEPYILEVNKGPDMVPKCEKDEKLKKKIYEEIFTLAGVLIKPFQYNNFKLIYSYNFDL